MDSPREKIRSWGGWTALRRRLSEALAWAIAVAALTGLAHVTQVPSPERTSAHDDIQIVVQVVPAVVIAIFVFAVGTLFVVAQVVPQARGTRAVELLRRRHIAWTISPALALTPLSALLLVIRGDGAGAFALALLIGAAIYLFASTACLLAILGEATDPMDFGALLQRRARRALSTLEAPDQTDNDGAKAAATAPRDIRPSEVEVRWPGVWLDREQSLQAATNDLYAVVRTLRGWARSAATSGDSRELQEALECTLEVVTWYAGLKKDALARQLLPSNYWHNARTADANPLYAESFADRIIDSTPLSGELYERYSDWALPPFRFTDPELEVADVKFASLPGTWLAVEVGRSHVRAVEFAGTAKALLERDRGRLLLSLEKASRRFAESQDDKSAGVMVAALTELGLGARRCAAEELEWHYDPLFALARLHNHFCKQGSEELAVGTAGAVLKVAEAIAAARGREHQERIARRAWDGTIHAKQAERLAARTARELRSNYGLQSFRLFEECTELAEPEAKVKWLATDLVLEPHDPPVIHPPNGEIVHQLWSELTKP